MFPDLNEKNGRIIVADDNENFAFTLKEILEESGYDVVIALDGRSAKKSIKKYDFDIGLIDLKLPDIEGIELIKQLSNISPHTDFIIITGNATKESAIEMVGIENVLSYETKPIDIESLIKFIDQAIKNKKNIIGDSAAINKVLKKVNLIAPTNMSVIIQGESGTGKEVFANLIHRKSHRKENPFIAIDCGAIPESLFESELFGYKKGAFTGADKTKQGKFELANNGTLFLDEVANLPINTQAKFLRVIEERKITQIGGQELIKINVRIITASNIDLVKAVKQGKFREDLYHRLNGMKIILPLLKERKDDIPILAGNFLHEANKEFGKNIKNFSSDAIKKLLDYSWPGNVRELKNVIKRAVLLETREQIMPETFEFENIKEQNNSIKGLIENYTYKILKGDYSLSELYYDIEKGIIVNVLEEVKFNKSKTARLLGIDRNTLYKKMESMGIK